MNAMASAGKESHSFFLDQLPTIAVRVDRLLGLHFPHNRTSDLKNAFAQAASAFGYRDLDTFAQWFLNHPFSHEELALFASHFTIGETYFFREPETLLLLENQILPQLLATCAQQGRALRIWSAGCSTGEEAYTLALLLRRIAPGLGLSEVEILGTDINPHSLEIARKACYSAWAFRGLDPQVRKDCFKEFRPGRYRLLDMAREMVHFETHNLVSSPSPGEFDLILCRNVFLYFASHSVLHALQVFEQSLRPHGNFITSTTEIRMVEQSGVFSVHREGHLPVFSKRDANVSSARKIAENFPLPVSDEPFKTLSLDLSEWPNFDGLSSQVEESPWSSILDPFLEMEPLASLSSGPAASDVPPELGVTEEVACVIARKHADLGRLDCARDWCKAAIRDNPRPVETSLLLGVIEQEKGDLVAARRAFRSVLYLDPDNVMAHVHLGFLMVQESSSQNKWFQWALELLDGHEPEERVPYGDGLNAFQLAEMIRSALNGQTTLEVRP
jgi:chemotaxis protein methyltransferase CheR